MFTTAPTFSGYSVDDLAKAKAFYQDTLGLNLVETKEGLDITLFGGRKLFIYPKADHTPATFTVLNFVVPNITDAVAEIKEKGISIENYDTDQMRADEYGIYRGKAAGHGPDIAWFKDPAGNILSVIEE